MPLPEKELIESYIDSLINQLALEGAFLYKQGFIGHIKPCTGSFSIHTTMTYPRTLVPQRQILAPSS